MRLSFITTNRIVEQNAADDEKYHQQLLGNGKQTLTHGRTLSDEALLQKLHSLGLQEVNRQWLDHWSRQAPTAEALAVMCAEQSEVDIPEREEDWIWIALTCLWERWFPDRPNVEMIDDRMQAGYQAQQRGETVVAAQLWLQTWQDVRRLMTAFKLESIAAFDDRFGCTQSVFNWVQDLAFELERAERIDPTYTSERRVLYQAVLRLVAKSNRDQTLAAGFKRDLDECQAGNFPQAPELPATRELKLNEIIAELDRDYTGVLPIKALRQAQQNRKEIIPRLIELIRKATIEVRAGRIPTSSGHLFALYLLTEFRSTEALPAILEAVSLPGDGPFDLFGDSITEDLSRVFAALAADTRQVIDELIATRSLNEFVRWKAAQTYFHWVHDGIVTRQEAVARLRDHLHQACLNEDAKIAVGLVSALTPYASEDALPEINEAFRRELVDELIVNIDDVQECLAAGEAGYQRALRTNRPTGIRDTVVELRHWAAFTELPVGKKEILREHVPSDFAGDELDDEPGSQAPATIRYSGPRVGRNDPCPCGSGKKYKKCCAGR